ncbi:MAG: hypothetical protein ACRC9N_01380, partial [Aeromonas sp.]
SGYLSAGSRNTLLPFLAMFLTTLAISHHFANHLPTIYKKWAKLFFVREITDIKLKQAINPLNSAIKLRINPVN